LRSLLADPRAKWGRPAITTYGEGYFSARDDRYRYIQYPDGTEEVYDHQSDPHEFDNVAGQENLAPVKTRLAEWVPKRWAKTLGGRFG
jgi:hypothetical protein